MICLRPHYSSPSAKVEDHNRNTNDTQLNDDEQREVDFRWQQIPVALEHKLCKASEYERYHNVADRAS